MNHYTKCYLPNMRILLVNKFYYRRGGAETYLLEIEKKLKAEGHEVAIFSMQHPKNLPSEWSRFFVSRVSFNEGGIWQRIRAVARMFYSFEARRKFKALIQEFKPEVIHIHNIYHQISPSILPVAKQARIPVVMHLHDYKIISPNYSLYDGKRICEDCALPNYWRCFFKKCFDNSYIKSFLVSLETFFHQGVLNIYKKNIDIYIAPSQFMKDICVRHGLPESKVKVLYNFTSDEKSSAHYKEGDYFLYFGRLSEEKGLSLLLQAVAINEDVRLVIAGSGPDQSRLEKLASKLNINNRVAFVGYVQGKELEKVIQEAQAIVMPSVWLENMPFALLEALSEGKIVIASRIGGFKEIITNGENGYLCTPGNIEELAEIMKIVSNLSPEARERLKENAYMGVKGFNVNEHYRNLLTFYTSVRSKSS